MKDKGKALSTIKSLKIGGTIYKVLVLPEIIEDDRELFGQIKYNDSVIKVSKKFPSNIPNTILHECIHGLLEDRGIKHKEELVVQLTNGLIQLLRDNPELKKIL